MMGRYYSPSPGGVIVVRADHEPDPSALAFLASETGCMVVLLPRHSSIEMLDEEAMAEHGWVRQHKAASQHG